MEKERVIEMIDEVFDLTIELLDRDIKWEQCAAMKVLLAWLRAGIYKKIALEKDSRF